VLPIPIHIVSSDPSLKLKLTSWLRAQPDFLLAGYAQSLREAAEHTPRASADALLIDLTASDSADESMWAAIRFCYSDCLIAALYGGDCDRALRLAAAAGARSFLPKDASDELLFPRLKDALQGVPIIPDERFFERLWPKPKCILLQPDTHRLITPTGEALTQREREVLELLAEGLSNEEIAESLCLKTQTVKNYLKVIYSKLGVHDRVRAVLWAKENGLGGN
jgi:DNA-binding NarL/FixJ family response regulator